MRALYFEIYHLSARIVLDTQTWKNFLLTKESIIPSRFKKFRPNTPNIYTGNTDKIHLLPDDVIAPIMKFYFRIDAIRRDTDKDPELSTGYLTSNEVWLFKNRLRESIPDAIEAIKALRHHLPQHPEHDRELLKAHTEWNSCEDIVLEMEEVYKNSA